MFITFGKIACPRGQDDSGFAQPAPPRSADEILADPTTPVWITETFHRIAQANPVYAVFLKAMHDHRIGR